MKTRTNGLCPSVLTLLLLALAAGMAGCEKPPNGTEVSVARPADVVANDATKAANPEHLAVAPPEFKRIFAPGMSGNGVVQKFLMADGRDFTGTSDSHDSRLIDSTALPEEKSVQAIKASLADGVFAIVDGGETSQSSDKLSRIMMAAVGFSVNGATAYVVQKNIDGSLNVTPLQTAANEKGEKSFDQLANYFTVLTN
jgi:hypothetical protein